MSDIASRNRQEAAGVHLAVVVHKHRSTAVVYGGRATDRLHAEKTRLGLPRPLLQKVTLIVLPFRSFHLEVNPARSLVELGENLLRFFRAEHFCTLFRTGRNEKEYVPCRHV